LEISVILLISQVVLVQIRALKPLSFLNRILFLPCASLLLLGLFNELGFFLLSFLRLFFGGLFNEFRVFLLSFLPCFSGGCLIRFF